MRFFLNNAQVVLDNIERERVVFGFNPKIFSKDWMKSLVETPYQDVSQTRIRAYCKSNSCHSKLDKEEVEKILKRVCNQDSRLLVKVCSEKDRLYGMTNTVHAYNLIKDSDALLAVNESGNAKGCQSDRGIMREDFGRTKACFTQHTRYLYKGMEIGACKARLGVIAKGLSLFLCGTLRTRGCLRYRRRIHEQSCFAVSRKAQIGSG